MDGKQIRRVLAQQLAAAVCCLALAPAARALTIDVIAGAFSNTQDGANKSYTTGSPVPGFGTGLENTARWGRGVGAVGAPNSGLGFTPNVAGLVVVPEAEFVIGRVRHFNHPITGAATATTLTFTLQIAGASPAIPAFPYSLVIFETDNIAPCAYAGTTICPDRIDNATALSGHTFVLDGTTYTLSLLGWRTGPSTSDPFTSFFLSEEGGTSTAYLVGKITTDLGPAAPEPGSYLLVGLGLAGIAAARRPRAPGRV